jgi:hypothetical protein
VKFSFGDFFNTYSDVPLMRMPVEGIIGKLALIDNNLYVTSIVEEERIKEIVVL